MTDSNLQIIGTIHLDPKGEEKLDSFIQGYRPHAIGLEMNVNRESIGSILRGRFNELIGRLGPKTEEERRAITEFSKYAMDIAGFELRSTQKYGNTAKVPLGYIDSDIVNPNDYVNFIIRNIRSLFPVDLSGKSVEDLKDVLKFAVGAGYFVHEIGWSGEKDLSEIGEEDAKVLRSIYSDERNDFMASSIRGIYDRYDKVLAVVGLGHLRDLEKRLVDLSPTCLSLDDAGRVY